MFKLVQLGGRMTCSNLFNVKLVQSESGQLTSYWNAFLFVICTLDPTKKVWYKRAPGCIEHLSLQQNHWRHNVRKFGCNKYSPATNNFFSRNLRGGIYCTYSGEIIDQVQRCVQSEQILRPLNLTSRWASSYVISLFVQWWQLHWLHLRFCRVELLLAAMVRKTFCNTLAVTVFILFIFEQEWKTQ